MPADVFDGDLDIEADPDVVEHVQSVQEAAKARFSITDRLAEKHYATDKVLVFQDATEASKYGAMQVELDRAQAVLAQLEPGTEQHTGILETYNQAEEEAIAQRDVMMQSALAISLVALPQVVFERCQRKARKRLGLKGQIPEDRMADYNTVNQDLLIGASIVKIVDHTGAEADFDKDEIGAQLRQSLEVPQYGRLFQKFNLLVFNDSIGRAATADPGF
jgi:hypothetical protein